MILILSAEGDLSTDLVISWLKNGNYPYYRLNSFDLIEDNLHIDINENKIILNNEEINLNKINTVWYRKFGFFRYSTTFKEASKHFSNEMMNQLSKEFTSLLGSIYSMLNDKKWLVDPKYAAINKIDVLRIAKSVGLNIPKTHIINNKLSIDKIKENVISKSIYDPYFIPYERGRFGMYTTKVEKNNGNIKEKFFPSLIQEEIIKSYEIRTFYIKEEMYSMAIFSQGNKQTEIDFRKYMWDRPNRNVPYELPVEIECKIRQLMKNLKLNCGSIDMIKSTDGKIYFLEVNPSGQFGMVDFPCNYGLHKRVAEILMEMDKSNE